MTVIQFLVSNGHREPEVLDYTYLKARYYVEACERLLRARQAEQLDILRAAYHADDKAYAEFKDKLRSP